MRPEGWIFLAGSWAIIVALSVFCFFRVVFKEK